MDKALFLTAEGNRAFPVKGVAVCGNTAPAAMGFFPCAASTVQAAAGINGICENKCISHDYASSIMRTILVMAAVLVFPSPAAGSLGTWMLNINPSTLFFLQNPFCIVH